MVPVSFKSFYRWCVELKNPRSSFEVLPLSRLAANEMSLGVFHLLFMQSFLWNAGIGWTIPNRNSCECLPLIKPPLMHKHSPSCSNRLANLILKHFFLPHHHVHCDIFSFFFKASASSLLTSRPPAVYANIENSEARTRPSATALTTIPLEGRVEFTTV